MNRALRRRQNRGLETASFVGAEVDAASGETARRRERARSNLRLGDLKAALEDFKRVVQQDGSDAESFLEIGKILSQGHNNEGATAAFLQAVALDPGCSEAYFGLATLRMRLGDFAAALGLLRHVAALAPDNVEVAAGIVWTRLNACDWPNLDADFRACLSLCLRVGKPIPPFILIAFGMAPEDFLLWSRAWVEANAPAAAHALAPYAARRPIEGRLRVGYVSADFKDHATAVLMTDLLECHDRTRFKIFGYNIGTLDESRIGARMVAATDHFVDISMLNDQRAADRIHQDGIDILIDLKGFTADARPGILAHRPAPIQVNYLGYPATMGAPYMDYIVADPIVAPLAHAKDFDEKIVHLPHCYQPNDRDRPRADPSARRADHGLPEAGFIFCCFNANYKITPILFDVWMRLLHEIPGSVLWVLQSNDAAMANLVREARNRGIDPGRQICFAPRLASDRHHARLGLADLFLDTVPVNAHTTASEMLWSGVPVLTLSTAHFAGRVAASLVDSLGLPELVAPDLAAYEREAIGLARDPARLRVLRDRIATRRTAAPLFDTPRYVRNYEAALTRMADLRESGHAPEAFAVADFGAGQ